jgi:hypothetical protein
LKQPDIDRGYCIKFRYPASFNGVDDPIQIEGGLHDNRTAGVNHGICDVNLPKNMIQRKKTKRAVLMAGAFEVANIVR